MIITPIEPRITVDYWEDENSPQENFTDAGFKAKRILRCAWSDRLTLARQLKGGLQNYGDNYNYYAPAPYPYFTAARVKTVEIEGDGDPEDQAIGGSTTIARSFEHAVLTVGYEVQRLDELTIVEESVEPAAEFLTLPTKGLYWGTGSSKVALEEQEAPGQLIPMFDWVYRIRETTSLPDWFGTLEGSTNNAALKSKALDKTFPEETLLAGRPRLNRKTTNFGEKAWEIEVRFTYRSIPWNLFPRPVRAAGGGISWEPITDGTNIIKFYPPQNLEDIII